MKAEIDRFAREKKELTEQIQEVESQLEWHRSERDDEMKKLTTEKKMLQDRLHDAESQLSQLKSRKRDELKVSNYFSLLSSLLTSEPFIISWYSYVIFDPLSHLHSLDVQAIASMLCLSVFLVIRCLHFISACHSSFEPLTSYNEL